MDLHSTHQKRPGEDLFGLILLVFAIGMFWQSWKISGFSALSSPGAFPLAVSAVMVIAAMIVVIGNLRVARGLDRDRIMPLPVAAFIGLVALYAMALAPLGFLPASLLFLFIGIRFLYHGGWIASAVISVGALIVVYVVFRLVFQVILPEGIVPEREWMASIGNLFSAGGTE